MGLQFNRGCLKRLFELMNDTEDVF